MENLWAVVLTFLVSSALFAGQIAFDPPRPTPQTPVTLKIRALYGDTCVPRVEQVQTAGSNTIVTFRIPTENCGVAVTVPWKADIALGLLPGGGHSVVFKLIRPDGTVETATYPLVVFEQFRLIASPTTIPTMGGTEISVGLDYSVVCPEGQCSDPVFAIDGQEIEPTHAICCIFGYGVKAPAHSPGAALLTVRDRSSNALLASAVLRYYDPSDTADDSVFESVLIPIIFSGPGAAGSQFTTNAFLLNRNNYDLPIAGRNAEEFKVLDLSAESRPAGWTLRVPREAANQVHYGILVRDVTRQSEALGTEIPVARERDLRTYEFFMLNVPIDRRSRQTLRIYAVGVETANAEVAIVPMSGMGRNIGTHVTLKSGNADTPAFVSLDLSSQFPELIDGGPYQIKVIVTANFDFPPAWAFVTVTNNTTQHVTAITPQ